MTTDPPEFPQRKVDARDQATSDVMWESAASIRRALKWRAAGAAGRLKAFSSGQIADFDSVSFSNHLGLIDVWPASLTNYWIIREL